MINPKNQSETTGLSGESLIGFNEAILELVNYYGYSPELAEKYLLELKEAVFVDESRLQQIHHLHKPYYYTYLKSERWQEIKRAAREYYSVCQECGSSENLQVHHLSYEKLGREEFEDLTLLCEKCHKARHH